MQQINWGIIGCGNVTERKSGPAFGKVDGSRLIAVMRRDGEKAKDYAARHNIPMWSDNADDLINNPEINAIYIATPPADHTDYAIRAMKKGKFVYVEKPMAANYTDCVNMCNTSVQTGMPLYVAYYRRYLPYFIKVKEILDSNLLGDLQYVKVDFHIPARPEDFNANSLPWRVKPDIAGAGYFYDLACHQFDLFEWFFGQASDIKGKSYNRRGLYEAEDLVFASVEYDSGLPLTGNWCFTVDENQRIDVIKVFGTKATLEFSTFEFTPVRVISSSGIEEFLPPNPENIQFWFIKNMVKELQKSVPGRGNCESAMRTNLIMDKILGKL